MKCFFLFKRLFSFSLETKFVFSRDKKLWSILIKNVISLTHHIISQANMENSQIAGSGPATSVSS